MKVFLISNTFGSYGGMEAFTLNLATYLLRNGIEVRLCFRHLKAVTQMDESLEHACRPIYHHVIHLSKNSDLSAHITWADLVHSQNPSPAICFPCSLLSTPLFLTIHHQFSKSSFYKNFLHRRSRDCAAQYYYNSSFVQESWEKNPGQPRVVFTNSDTHFSFAPFENRKGFISMSRLVANKGVDLLIQAYLQAKIDHQQYPLTIIGEGPLLPKCRALAKDSPHIFFTGFVSSDQKYQLLAQSKWLVAVPEVAEDMGLTPLEARSQGVPCIISNMGGLPEVAGKEAIITKDSSLNSLVTSLEEAATMSEYTYQKQAHSTFTSAKKIIVPYSFYPEEYRKII